MTAMNSIGNVQLDVANNLSDIPNKPLALSNIGGIGAATTDTLTNKTMSGLSNTFTNLPAGALSGVVPVANGGTANTNYTLTDSSNLLSENWNTRQLYANDGTTLKIDWSDPNQTNFTSIQGIEFAVVPGAAPVINYITVNGAPTGNSPIFTSVGSDPDVDMTFMTQGAGNFDFTTDDGTILLLQATANAANNIIIENAATGNAPKIYAFGTDTNINLQLQAQGTGFVFSNQPIHATNGFVANGVTYPTGTPATGQVITATSSTTSAWQNAASLPVTTQEVYVSLQGSDITGTGTAINPYATITYAQTQISPTTTSRYTIWVTPGFYSENISLDANVFIVATSPVETRLLGNIDINNTSWNVNNDNRSGFVNIELRGTITFNFAAQTNNLQGKLYLYNVRISNQPQITGLSTTESNQVVFDNCYFFSGVSNTGCITQAVNCYNASGVYQNNSSASASIATDFEIVGGGNDGTYSNTWTANLPCTMEIEGVGFTNTTTLATSGASATTTINGGSLPMRANVTTSSGGSLVVLGDSSIINSNINLTRALSAQTLAASTGRQPSTTHDTFISFSGTIVNVSALTSSITLQSSPNNSTWTTLQVFTTPLITTGSTSPFSALIPASYYYRWVSGASAGGTNTISTIQELSL